MFDLLFNTTLNVSPAELIGTCAFGALFALACVAIILGVKWMRTTREAPAEPAATADPPMLVVAPWSEAGASDVLAGEVLWRHQTEAEAAPVFAGTPLPAHKSVWKFPSWNLDDPERTQMWPIIRGYDAEDLDPGPEPKVDPNTRGRFVRSDRDLAAMASALGYEAKEQRKPFATVDAALAEAAERLGKAKASKASAEVSA